MWKDKKLLALIGCLLAVVSLLVIARRQPEPIYEGSTLTYWANRYARAYSQSQRAFLPLSNVGYVGVDVEAEKAIKTIGTNALPQILKWLHFEQDHFSVRLFYSLGLSRLPVPLRNWVHQLAFSESAQSHAQSAFYVLQILGPQASLAASDLLGLCNNPAEPDTAYRSFAALGALGTNALPQLMQVLRKPNHPYRGAAVRQVEDILRHTSRSSLQLPMLLQCLQDRDSSLVVLVSQLLCEPAPNRAAAIPILEANLLSQDPSVRAAATNTLLAISPALLHPAPDRAGP